MTALFAEASAAFAVSGLPPAGSSAADHVVANRKRSPAASRRQKREDCIEPARLALINRKETVIQREGEQAHRSAERSAVLPGEAAVVLLRLFELANQI